MTQDDDELLIEATKLAKKIIRSARVAEEKRAKAKWERIEFNSYDSGEEILQKIRNLSDSDHQYTKTLQKIMNEILHEQQLVSLFADVQVFSKESMQQINSLECPFKESKENEFLGEIDLPGHKVILQCYLVAKETKLTSTD